MVPDYGSEEEGKAKMAGLNLTDLKYFVVEPALTTIGLNTVAGLNMVTGTALAESEAQRLKQVGGGPALGLWQVEPATEEDAWKNFLEYNSTMANQVRSLLAPGATTPQLIYNLMYGAVMCRLKYWRSPLELPAYNDAAGMANIHKQVYNTASGAADPSVNTPLFQQAIEA